MLLEQDQGDPAGGEVKRLLWTGIVNPLRKYAVMHAYTVLLSKLGLYTGHIAFYDIDNVWFDFGMGRKFYEIPPPSTPKNIFISRNGVVRYESVMRLRNKLEELGKMKGVNQDEKGGCINLLLALCLSFNFIQIQRNFWICYSSTLCMCHHSSTSSKHFWELFTSMSSVIHGLPVWMYYQTSIWCWARVLCTAFCGAQWVTETTDCWRTPRDNV